MCQPEDITHRHLNRLDQSILGRAVEHHGVCQDAASRLSIKYNFLVQTTYFKGQDTVRHIRGEFAAMLNARVVRRRCENVGGASFW